VGATREANGEDGRTPSTLAHPLQAVVASSLLAYQAIGVLNFPVVRGALRAVVPATLYDPLAWRALQPTSHGYSLVFLSQVLTLSVLCAAHWQLLLGRRRGGALLVAVIGVAGLAEELALMTGFGFGWYRFSSSLGPRLGLMPLAVPLLWLAALTLSAAVVRAIVPPRGRGVAACVVRAAAVAFIMAAWDLVNEGVYSSGGGHRRWGVEPTDAAAVAAMAAMPGDWTWLNPPGTVLGLFRAPVSNTMGWLILGFTLALMAQVAEAARAPCVGATRRAHGRAQRPLPPLVEHAPLVAYACTTFFLAVHPNHTASIQQVAALAMGTPAWLAALALIERGND
jgi:uncharacterized membrane protein